MHEESVDLTLKDPAVVHDMTAALQLFARCRERSRVCKARSVLRAHLVFVVLLRLPGLDVGTATRPDTVEEAGAAFVALDVRITCCSYSGGKVAHFAGPLATRHGVAVLESRCGWRSTSE